MKIKKNLLYYFKPSVISEFEICIINMEKTLVSESEFKKKYESSLYENVYNLYPFS
jgi:hypothetical protein